MPFAPTCERGGIVAAKESVELILIEGVFKIARWAVKQV
jgi:hypothetical protein